jgi:hypothetical protein
MLLLYVARVVSVSWRGKWDDFLLPGCDGQHHHDADAMMAAAKAAGRVHK